MRWQIFTEIRGADFVFVAVDTQLERFSDLGFRTKYYFVECLSICVVNTCFVNKSEFWCQGRPIVSSVIQEVPPVAVNVLILGVNFPISPIGVCCLGSQGNFHFFSPNNEVGIDGGTALFVYNRLRNSKSLYTFLSSRDSCLSSSDRNCVCHQETRKSINNQEIIKDSGTSWVKRSFAIDKDCSERKSLVLSFFQWYFISVFKFSFIVQASQTITHPVKHARPVAETFCYIVSFGSAHKSNHVVVVAKTKTS